MRLRLTSKASNRLLRVVRVKRMRHKPEKKWSKEVRRGRREGNGPAAWGKRNLQKVAGKAKRADKRTGHNEEQSDQKKPPERREVACGGRKGAGK